MKVIHDFGTFFLINPTIEKRLKDGMKFYNNTLFTFFSINNNLRAGELYF